MGNASDASRTPPGPRQRGSEGPGPGGDETSNPGPLGAPGRIPEAGGPSGQDHHGLGRGGVGALRGVAQPPGGQAGGAIQGEVGGVGRAPKDGDSEYGRGFRNEAPGEALSH